jgi:hypothetical protein
VSSAAAFVWVSTQRSSRVYLVGSEAQELLVIAVPFHYRSLGGTRWDADGDLF